jgi:hypothetical protein
MSPQFRAAFFRGLYVAVPSALLTALTTWQTTNNMKAIIIAAGTAFLAPFVVRAGAEGWYDSNRASKGDVKAGDVQPLPVTPQPQFTEPAAVR